MASAVRSTPLDSNYYGKVPTNSTKSGSRKKSSPVGRHPSKMRVGHIRGRVVTVY